MSRPVEVGGSRKIETAGRTGNQAGTEQFSPQMIRLGQFI